MLPDVDYVKILVNPTELKLVVQPSKLSHLFCEILKSSVHMFDFVV